jgi:hypothetical protein
MSNDPNALRSAHIIAQITKNKHLDLRQRATEIENQLKNNNHQDTLQWFDLLISIDHAKHYGLNETHPDRDGGWGFSDKDNNFLSSLRQQFLGHAYGIRVNWSTVKPLTAKQITAIARCISRPFYTLQLALIKPA